MDHYHDRFVAAWRSVNKNIMMTDIPVAKAQLMGRVGDFDGGQTGKWMASLVSPTWRAVRDAHTGHVIHCVSDRPFNELTSDLRLCLRLLAWMSGGRITAYWWDQPWARLLPADTEPRKEHLNGGWAVPGVPEIHVYRREEVHKVFLHETIHAIGLDVSPALVEPVRLRFEGVMERRLWPHLGEAFTELFAEWLWAIAGPGSWAHQLECSERQAIAVWARIRDTKEEDTSVFAYYILKWVLMQHMEEVMMAPDRSVSHWFDWWCAARPGLDLSATTTSQSQSLRMGMTCSE